MYGSEKRQQVGSQLDQGLKGQKNDKERDSNTLGDKEIDNRNVSCDSKKEPEENKEYLAKYNGNKMTVVFHAVLSPNFKFDASQGDRIFMRFGGVRYGNFNENVTAVHPER